MRRLAASLAAFLSFAAFGAGAEESARTLYLLRCSGCHGITGAGSKPGRVPGLAGIDRILLHEEGRLYLANVPGIENSGLSDGETARLLNWMVQTWGEDPAANAGPPLTSAEVGRLKTTPVDDLVALRSRIAAELLGRGVEIGSYSGK